MTRLLTIKLPDDSGQTLEELGRRQCRSAENVAKDILERALAVARWQQNREHLQSRAEAVGLRSEDDILEASREGGLDTNVLLSAAFFPGVCEKLLAHCFLTPSIQLVLYKHALGEFVEHGLGRLNGTGDQIDAAVAELQRRCQIVAPAPVSTDTKSDSDDLAVLGTAVAGEADCLITGDRELLNLGSFHSIVILLPRVFYDRLRVD
jgi:putative PIN family toxin of toxin-antitoxin system